MGGLVTSAELDFVLFCCDDCGLPDLPFNKLCKNCILLLSPFCRNCASTGVLTLVTSRTRLVLTNRMALGHWLAPNWSRIFEREGGRGNNEMKKGDEGVT